MRLEDNFSAGTEGVHADASFNLGGQKIGGNFDLDLLKHKKATPDPYINLRFWVEVGHVKVAGFTECTGFQVETEMFEYQEGGENSFVHKLPTRQKFGNITLKRGIDEAAYFYDWFMSSTHGKTSRRDITIHVYNSLQKEVLAWHLSKAYPVKWTCPDLKADTGGIAVETIELAYHGVVPVPSKGQTAAAAASRFQDFVAAVRDRVSLNGFLDGGFKIGG